MIHTCRQRGGSANASDTDANAFRLVPLLAVHFSAVDGYNVNRPY